MINDETAKHLKTDFPIFKNNPKLVYLDNGATTQKPTQVIEKIKEFYENYNANASRGLYGISEKTTTLYSNARKIVADFINSDSKEIIFTKNTTDSLNSLAYVIENLIPKGKDEIVLTEMEHHSNLIPWQQLAKRKNWKLKFIRIKEDFSLDLEDAKEKINSRTAIVAFTHVSNALGTINPAKEIIKLARENNALSVIDATQSVPHMKVDVRDLDCDFLVFSGHKMLAPNGVGVLYGKKELLEKMPPFSFGGGMIKSVSFEDAHFADLPEKFEAGTQNIADVLGLAEAIKYLEKIGMNNVENWEHELRDYLIKKLEKIEGVEIYNPEKSSGIVSMNVKNAHPHDVASMLDEDGIAVRAGHHCCMPLMKKLGLNGTIRLSFYIYNTFEDIDKFVEAIKKIKEKFA
ncbi:MAG: cysteine desulfurase [Nanoarchaeota archaeon]